MTGDTPDGGHADRPRIPQGRRDPTGRYVRTLEGAERDAEACRLRTTGLSYRAISDQLGYGGATHARDGVERALAAVVAEPAEQLRTLELERLDALQAEAWAVMTREHLTVSGGKIVMVEGPDGVEAPLGDDAPVLKAIDRIVKLMERRAKLLGLDAPTRLSVDAETLGREIGELLDALGGTDDHTER